MTNDTGITKAREKAAEMRAAGIVIRPKTPLEKLAENPLSLRRAIDARCYQCEGEDADPAVKWRIGNCLQPDCALYAVRPHQRLQGTDMPKVLAE